MTDNIFKKLRLEHTEEIVMQGEGRKCEVKQPYSVSRLAKELHLHYDTVLNAEKGLPPSLATVEAYHRHFKTPYSTLLGETTTNQLENLNINLELGLTDKSISSIKSLNPLSLAMLNVLLSQEVNLDIFLHDLAETIYSMSNILSQNGMNKADEHYLETKELSKKLFMQYMKTITFKELKDVLYQIEQQTYLIETIPPEEKFDL